MFCLKQNLSKYDKRSAYPGSFGIKNWSYNPLFPYIRKVRFARDLHNMDPLTLCAYGFIYAFTWYLLSSITVYA